MLLRPQQSEALAIIGRWYSLHKCHRVEQLMHDHPEFAREAANYYQHADNNMSPMDVVIDLITRDVPGFAEAIMDANVKYSAIAPAELLARRQQDRQSGLSL